jgi:hypothetical protein
MAKKTRTRPDHRSPEQIIKDFCPVLEAFGITAVEAEYDTEHLHRHGNESSFKRMVAIRGARDENRAQYPHPNKQIAADTFDSPDNIDTEQLNFALRVLTDHGEGEKQPMMQVEETNKFKNALAALLPAEWRQGYGSLGSMSVDVLSGKVRIVHQARRMELEETVRIFNDPSQPVSVAAAAATL